MKTFASKEKRSTPAVRKTRPYVHHPMGPVQLAQRAEIHRILRSTGAQAKLTVGEPNDKYEQEADRVADRVMRMSIADVAQQVETGRIQRMCSECEAEQALQRQPIAEEEEELQARFADEHMQRQPIEEEEEELQAKEQPGQTPQVQRQEEPPEEDEEAQAKEDGGSVPSVSASVESGINTIRRAGSSLSESTRSFFEPRFGTDFSGVRIHTDSNANHLARSVNSKALTVGQDVVFDSGQYSPGSRTGRSLLAHELTHVVQQTGAGGKKIDRSNVSFDLSPIGVQPMIQRDLAIEPPRPAAVGRVLTPAQMADAITFNNQVLGSIANSADIIEMIRDVIGVSQLPSVVDADFINGVVQWQANLGLSQDGKLGPTTARPLFREIGAEGVGRGEVSRRPQYTPAGPINVARGGVRSAPFTMSAEFRSDPTNGVFPSCCEVRQEIQWDAAFVAASVAAGNGAVPHGGFAPADPVNTWIEDRDPTGTRRLGYRSGRFSEGIPGNRYLDSAGRVNQAFGHRYEGTDAPTGFAADRGSWSFRLGAYDMCNGNRLLRYSPTLVVNWL